MSTFFKNLPITNVPDFPAGISITVRRVVVALLIEEHGVELAKSRDSYKIKSPIFAAGGYGDVALSTRPRKVDELPHKFTSLSNIQLGGDSLKKSNSLASTYGISPVGAVRWTGDRDSNTVWEYLKFASFADFITYVLKRLKLGAEPLTRPALSTALTSYSGKVAGYASAVLNLYDNVSIVEL